MGGGLNLQSLGGERSEAGWARCAPVLCGFAGVALLPASSRVGNELGLEVRGGASLQVDSPWRSSFFVGLKPVLRVFLNDGWRLGSVLGR